MTAARTSPTEVYVRAVEMVQRMQEMRRLVRQIIEHQDATPESILQATDMQFRAAKNTRLVLDSSMDYFDKIHQHQLHVRLAQRRKEADI